MKHSLVVNYHTITCIGEMCNASVTAVVQHLQCN